VEVSTRGVYAGALPEVRSWTSQGVQALRNREAFFRALEERLRVPGADVRELPDLRDTSWRNATFAVHYPRNATDVLPKEIRPFVQLEVGSFGTMKTRLESFARST
jgi:hypothetical protein